MYYSTIAVEVPVPEDLEVESVGESWIVLSWSLFPGEVLITEQIILVSGGGTRRNITLEGNRTLFNVTDLQSGTEYSFRVIAVNSAGQTSLPSAPLTATTTIVEGVLFLDRTTLYFLFNAKILV